MPPEEQGVPVVVVPAATATEAGATETVRRALPNAKLLFTALGVTALLALAGFVVKISQEQFLGLTQTQWGSSELSTTASRWLSDTVLLVCQVGMQHPVVAVLFCLLLMLPAIVAYEFDANSKPARVARPVIVAGWAVALLLTLVRLQLPVIPVENWLTAGLSEHFTDMNDLQPIPCEKGAAANAATAQQNADGTGLCYAGKRMPLIEKHLHERTLAYNREIFLAKAGDLGQMEQLGCHAESLPKVVQDLNIREDQWVYRAADAQRWLQNRYVLQIVLCGGAALALLALAGTYGRSRLDSLTELLATATAFTLLPICLLFVPYSYGKILCPTVLPNASLELADKPSLTGWLLERTDNTTALLMISAKVPSVAVYRNDKVQSMTIDRKEDVLRGWNASCWFDPRQGH